ncbi:hypothetical protein Mgra_00004403 [Meloidogyne graminicola]|uniref:Uncharacterized protein n=1 Tax=Meloidogyne graminicola TaxID=189291 RepID=A0A8S9ZSB5_9BILA|nr:hypothetical protein Mgra_00004403 [Meloidogyne graminicola]
MLLKHKRNMDASFGILRELRQLRLLICWVVTAMALINQTVAGNDEEVGYGHHKKIGDTVTLREGSWKIAANNKDLKKYKELKNSQCLDVVIDDGNIIVRYTKQGLARKEGCMVDLLTGSKTAAKFTIGIKNAPDLKTCLDSSLNYHGDCGGVKDCTGDWTDKLEPSSKNSMPFFYGRSRKDFENILNGVKASGEGCSKECTGNVKCLKWTGLAAGFLKDYDKLVLRTMVGIGDPGGSYCTIEGVTISGKDASFDITVDSGRQAWFQTSCKKDDQLFPGVTTCVDKAKMGEDLNDVIAWEIKDAATKIPGSDGFNHLFTFTLLPQRVHQKHTLSRNYVFQAKGIIDGETLSGPFCDEMYVRFPAKSFKLLVPSEDAPPPPSQSVEIPAITSPQTLPPLKDEGKGNGMMIIIIIVGVVFLLLVVGGVLVWLFVLRKSEPDAVVEEDYFGTTKAGTTAAKTKAGTTVGATQAKTGGMTTTNAGTTAKTTAVETKGGTTAAGTKAGTTVGGGKTTKTKK